MAAKINEIIGDNKLKKAYGKKAIGLIPNVAIMYEPQVVHGIKADVTVALSSIARDKFLAAKLRFAYSSLYMRPGMTIAKY